MESDSICIEEALVRMSDMKGRCVRGEDWELYLSMETTLQLLKEMGFKRISKYKGGDYE